MLNPKEPYCIHLPLKPSETPVEILLSGAAAERVGVEREALLQRRDDEVAELTAAAREASLQLERESVARADAAAGACSRAQQHKVEAGDAERQTLSEQLEAATVRLEDGASPPHQS